MVLKIRTRNLFNFVSNGKKTIATANRPNRKYTRPGVSAEFKADVLRLIANGESILGIAQKMGISNSIIHAWRAAEKKMKAGLTFGGEKAPSTLENETVRRCGRIAPAATPPNGDGTRHFEKSCRHFQSRRGTSHDLSQIYKFIKGQEPDFPVRLLCKTLELKHYGLSVHRFKSE